MIWGYVALLAVGVFLSAFFSGSETGFFRVSRVRLVLDGLGGDFVARGLLWLTNNPALFVATTLIGNNLANYLCSMAVVQIAHTTLPGASHVVEIVASVLIAPLVFVYGELLPKHVFYHAPNRLLRRAGPLFLLCTAVFSPIAALLWGLGRCLQWLVGESPARLRLTLARRELQDVFAEGQEAGILQPVQRLLVNNLFTLAGQSVIHFSEPISRVVSVCVGSPKSEALRLARRQRLSVLLVCEPQGGEPVGYVRTVDLYLSGSDLVDSPRKLIEFRDTVTHSAALLRMQIEQESVARVVNASGTTVGILYADRLTDPLFRET